MATGNVNYKAVLADLEARKTQIESAIAAVKNILASAGVITNGGGEEVIRPENIPTGAFLRLSIADATKRFLDMVKTKQSVQQIMQALERGGLPPAKYTTVYAVLRRRESQFGDLIRVGDEWALSEWYPNNPNLRKRTPEKATKGKGKKSRKKAAKKAVSASPGSVTSSSAPATNEKPVITIPDAAEQVLTESKHQLHAKVIAELVNQNYGKNTTAASMSGSLVQDSKHRFRNVGGNIWELAKSSEK